MAERVQTARDERGWFSSPGATALLWTGILAGPIAWALDLTGSYAIVQWTCGSQHTSVLHLITLAALVITAAGAAASWRAFQQASGDATQDGPRPVDRARFMAGVRLVCSAVVAPTLIGNAIHPVMLHGCL